MIAAQLLAYYFTELKDDQVKKVSPRPPRTLLVSRGRFLPGEGASFALFFSPALCMRVGAGGGAETPGLGCCWPQCP